MKINAHYLAIIVVLVGVHQIHAMEINEHDEQGMELPLLVSHALASRGVDGDSEGEDYTMEQLVQQMCSGLEEAAESGEQGQSIRQKIIDELLKNHSAQVYGGAFDQVLQKIPSHLLCKEGSGNSKINGALPILSCSLCSHASIYYNKPSQKSVEFKKEDGMVRADIVPDGNKSVIRIQLPNADTQESQLLSFEIDKECTCFALNESLSRIVYVKKNDGIYYRDLRDEAAEECRVLILQNDDWISTLALSPSGDKLMYRRKKGAYVYDIPTKIFTRLYGYGFKGPSIYKWLTAVGIAGGSVAAIGAFFGYLTAPHYCDGKQINEGESCWGGEHELDPGAEKTRLCAWVGALVGSLVSLKTLACIACCPCGGELPSVGFLNENTVQAQYRCTTHTWDVSLSDLSIDEFKKKCRLQVVEDYKAQVAEFEKMAVKDANKDK